MTQRRMTRGFWMMVMSFVVLIGLEESVQGCIRFPTDSKGQVGETSGMTAPAPLLLTSSKGSLVPCTLTNARYPTVPGDMANVYAGRSFYADGNHLGYDIAYPAGTAIHPIGCGVLRIYRAASGYGRLAIVIEHQLPMPMVFTNGLGEQVTVTNFLSIYGHQRQSQDSVGEIGVLGHKTGDVVGPDDVISYVDDAATNGDGGVHLHLGIRLQSMTEAQAVDVNWFRGYDGTPSQRKWYADPALFMATLTSNVKPVFWHPPGTFVRRPAAGMIWAIDGDMNRHQVDTATVVAEGIATRAIDVTDAELQCLAIGSPYVSPRAGHRVVKFDDSSTVYEFTGLNSGSWRKAFLSYDTFRSWGWQDYQVEIWSAVLRNLFFSETQDQGLQPFRDGSLVQVAGQSEIAVVSQGRRLPILDWPTFLALGYRQEQIVTVGADVVDTLAGPRGALITSDLLAYCAHPSTCVTNCPPPSKGGGAGGFGGGGEIGVGGFGGMTSSNVVTSSSNSSSAMSSVVSSSSSSASSAGSSSSSSTSSSSSAVSSSSASSSSSSVSSGGGGTGVPIGKVLFRYDGPIVPGFNQFQGMWDPPGPMLYDWTPSTFALCPDTVSGDGHLECLLDMPSGTLNFLFTIHLGDGRWWGDMSCDPTGGCGATIGTVTLTGPTGFIAYEMKSNGSGPYYCNGHVSYVP